MHVNSLYSYDPARTTWTDLTEAAVGAPPLPRKDAGVAALGGRLWLFGGRADVPLPYGEVLNDLHVFDPAAGAAGAWLKPIDSGAGGPPPQARAGHTLATVGGLIYSFGGYTDWPGKTAPSPRLPRPSCACRTPPPTAQSSGGNGSLPNRVVLCARARVFIVRVCVRARVLGA